MPQFTNHCKDVPFKTQPFESEFQTAMAKVPARENFISIGGTVCFEKQIYNFTLRTLSQEASLWVEPASGSIDMVWKFIEQLASGKEKAALFCNHKGPRSLLTAQTVQEEQLRLTLICETWLEEFHNEQAHALEFKEKCWPDCQAHVALDVIVPKRHFIYTFYEALLDIFINDVCYREVALHKDGSASKAQVDSLIIRQYLGYVPVTALDEELGKALVYATPQQAEELLKQGANPNALYPPEYKDGVSDTVLERFWYEGKWEYVPSKEELADVLEKNKLLCAYGAMPRDTFHLFYGSIIDAQTIADIFRLFFAQGCFMRFTCWDYFTSDIYERDVSEWKICRQLLKEKRVVLTRWDCNGRVYRSGWK